MERVYLDDEERKILAAFLDDWNHKPDKKTRDAFVSGEVLPKVQSLNPLKFGPEVISVDKSAKLMWESRVKVSVPGNPPASRLFNYCRQCTPGLKTINRSRTVPSSS
jgi:hypothetical protein